MFSLVASFSDFSITSTERHQHHDKLFNAPFRHGTFLLIIPSNTKSQGRMIAALLYFSKLVVCHLTFGSGTSTKVTIELLIRTERVGLLPYLGTKHRLREPRRLENYAGPEEHFSGTVALFLDDGLSQLLCVRRIPDLPKGILTQITQRLMDLADTDIAVRIYHGAEPASETGNDLSLALNRLNLGPLQHGFNDGSVTAGFAGGPQAANIRVEILIPLEVRPLKRPVLSVASNDG
jgi:hypothetical protein